MKDSSNNNQNLFIGLIFIIIGLISNEWIIAALFSSDGEIEALFARIAIWIFNLLSISLGLVIIKYNVFLRDHGRNIVFSIVTLLICFFLFEGGLRGFYYIKNKISSRDLIFSEYVGWQSQENAFWKRKTRGYGEITYTTVKYGFRVFGDVNTDKIKIFVIGDSYTQGTTVSDGNLYYDYLKKKLDNIEVFAYGAGGYGSLQEYMILDKYYDLIRPDIVIWQFCSNDLINNSYNLESASSINNSHMERPFYKKGRIEWLYPNQNWGSAYNMLNYSYLFRFLNKRFSILKAETRGTIEDVLTVDNPLMQESIKTTIEIMNLVKERVGDVPVIAFDVDKLHKKWVGNSFEVISRKSAIHFISNIPKTLAEAKEKGIAVDGGNFNTHWSKAGHAIAGDILLNYLVENNLLIANN